jgi:hypothetical protein
MFLSLNLKELSNAEKLTIPRDNNLKTEKLGRTLSSGSKTNARTKAIPSDWLRVKVEQR